MADRDQSSGKKSTKKFEVMGSKRSGQMRLPGSRWWKCGRSCSRKWNT